jgi:Family of unknown function (DUF6502)
MADSPKPAANTSERVLETAERILAPLVRLLIAKGVTFQMASEVLKQVYVRVAQKQFVDDDGATGTKLSLLTGLNRKEIRRLTSEELQENQPPPETSFAGAVHAVWRTQKRWLDKNGKPKVLPRRSSNNLLSFDDLVKSVTTDHRPSAVFEELMRLKYIDLDESENVVLKEATFLYTPDTADKLVTLAEHNEDHLAASIVNILESTPRFLERSVYSDEMSTKSAELMHEIARAEWTKLQDIILDKAIELEKQDAVAQGENTTRMRLGIYFYSENSKSSEP